VTFEVRYREQLITVSLGQDLLRLTAQPGAAAPVHVAVDDVAALLGGGQSLQFPVRAHRVPAAP
jgi:hypothetical protein